MTTQRRRWPPLTLNLLGEHQGANAAVAIAGIEQLTRQGWHIPDRAVLQGLAEVVWPARLEIIADRPWIVLDCTNVASAAALATAWQLPTAHRLLVFAGSADKDLAGMLGIFGRQFDRAVVTQFVRNPRASGFRPAGRDVEKRSAACGRPVDVCPDPAAALTRRPCPGRRRRPDLHRRIDLPGRRGARPCFWATMPDRS